MNRLMKHVLFLLCFVLAFVTGCKTKYVSVPEYHKEYIVKTDTFAKVDSVYIKDSVFVYHNGDTVIVNKIAYRDRYHNIYKVRIDTIFKRDSISVPMPVVAELSKAQQRYIKLGKLFVVIITLATVFIGIYWYRNKRC